jgi:Spy/CpxP family protein refolding chaperone
MAVLLRPQISRSRERTLRARENKPKRFVQPSVTATIHLQCMKTLHFPSLVITVPLVLLAAAGCAADSRGVEDDVDSESAALESSDPDPRGGPPMGPHALLSAALEEPGLTSADRATIEEALASLRPPKEEPEHRARAAALAAAIRSGSIDIAALRPADREIDERREVMHTRLTSALVMLHDTLDATERASVVTRVRAMRPDGARGDRPPHGPPPGDHLAMMLDGLDVDEAQRDEIEAAVARAGLGEPVARPEPPDLAALDAFLDSFTSSSFDAGALPRPPARPEPRLLEVLAVVVPLLDSAQRDTLAERILEGPPRPRARD